MSSVRALPAAERQAYFRRAKARSLARGDRHEQERQRQRARALERAHTPRCRRITEAEARRTPWLKRRGFVYRLRKWNSITQRLITTYANERTARAWCSKHGVGMP